MILRCDRQVAMLPLWDVQALVGSALTTHAAAHTVICSSLFSKGPDTHLLCDACAKCSREATALLQVFMLGSLMRNVVTVPCDVQAA